MNTATVNRIGIKQNWTIIEIRGMKDYCKEWIEEFTGVQDWSLDNFIYTSSEYPKLNIPAGFEFRGVKVSHFIMLENGLPIMVGFDDNDNRQFFNID